MSLLHTLTSACRHPAIAMIVGITFLSCSAVLLYEHARMIGEVQSVSVPLVAELPNLERTSALLKEQAELSELEASTRVGSQMERVRTYVLPAKADLDRVIATFELLRETLQSQGTLSRMSDLTFGEHTERGDALRTQPLRVEFAVQEEGLRDIAVLLQLTGLMMVGDALTNEEKAILLDRTESENPAGIVALEQFLSTDLLSYAQNPKLSEERLLRSFTSTMFVQSLQDITRTSFLRDITRVLGGTLGSHFDRQQLWPLQMLTVEEATITPGSAEGWYNLSLKLLVYTRSS